MAGIKKEDGGAVLYRVALRATDGRTATASTVVLDDATGKLDEATGAPVLFRFKVRTADGREGTSKFVLGAKSQLQVSDLRWGNSEHRHGAETTLHARVADMAAGRYASSWSTITAGAGSTMQRSQRP